MVLLENISLCNVLWDWQSKSESCLKFLKVVTILKNSLVLMMWGDGCFFWNRHSVRGWALLGTLPCLKVRGAPIAERRAPRGSADVGSHWFASTWGFLMLIVTYFLILPYFRVPYSLTIIISEWLLNSKGLSEHIWKEEVQIYYFVK